MGPGAFPVSKERTQQHAWSNTALPFTLFLIGWNEFYAGFLSFPLRSLLGLRLFQRRRLPIMEPSYRILVLQNGVSERVVALASVPGDDIGTLCADEIVFLQQFYILGCGVD